MTTAVRHRRVMVVLALAAALLLSACIVEQPAIETTGEQGNQQSGPAPTPEPTSETPLFEPTATPAPAPTVAATPTPEPTSTPAPPAGPTPIPTSAPEANFAPITVQPGLIVVPVRGASFRLSTSHPLLQLGGHTLLYVDDVQDAEVDIFTPVADRDGQPFGSYETLISFITFDEAFAALTEITPVSIAGFPTRVFEGPAMASERAFVTDLANADDEIFGWLPPARMRLWVIDHPAGPVIVSAESLENPGRYSEAVRLATEVLSTIDFG